jgi:chemotaxis protein CheX
MRVEFINPFIASLDNAFVTMFGLRVQRGPVSLKNGNSPYHEISGIIGLSGHAVGTVVLSVSKSLALRACSALLMTETTEINADVVDTVGELTNMVAGRAKAQLEQYQLMVSLPSVVTGRDHEIRFPSNVTPLSVAFTSDWGPLSLEVGFAPVPHPSSPQTSESETVAAS